MAAFKPRPRTEILEQLPPAYHIGGHCHCPIPSKTGRWYRGAKAEPAYEACSKCGYLQRNPKP